MTGQVNSDIKDGKIKLDAAPAQLYNLKEDPTQKNNLFGKEPKIQKELQEILISYRDSIEAYPELGVIMW